MLAILAAHALAALVAPVLVFRWGRRAFCPLALVPSASLVWVATNWPGSGGSAPSVRIDWVPQLSMNVDLRLDSRP